jgi:beta-mannanase
MVHDSEGPGLHTTKAGWRRDGTRVQRFFGLIRASSHRPTPGRGHRWLPTGAGLVMALVVILPPGLITANAPAAAAAEPSPPVVPGPGQAYLGAFVDPSGTQPRTPAELSALPAFNQGLARNLSLVRIDQSWTKPTTDDQLSTILASGGIPLIDWSCGATDQNVIKPTSQADKVITRFATQLAAWGAPVFLSWFPDPNAHSAATSQCLGARGPTGYRQAFTRIHDLFEAAGASNVSFVWSVTATGGEHNWADYYPGPGAVDWIAASGNANAATGTQGLFSAEFNKWYSTFASYGKPLMVGRTAAPARNQARYLTQVATALPARFPAIKAFVYYDAPGTGNYALGPAGLQAFGALSRTPYFQPQRVDTTTTVTVPPGQSSVGDSVHLSATTTASDQGGTISFTVNGAPISDCAAVSVAFSASCDTVTLPSGQNSVTAVYSGDAEFAGSTSAPAVVDVTNITPENPLMKPTVPSSGHAYLGGWINPIPLQDEPPGTTHNDAELNFLPGFNQGLGRNLSIVHVYQEWGNPPRTGQLRQILASGAIPMIDLTCGDSNAAIANGNDDNFILQLATQLAQLRAPVFLRWYYEPNFPRSQNYQNCIGSGGPAGYVQAWRHIHDLFVREGATNVAFVWCVATAGDQTNISDYYPGAAYVDWIAADGYYRPPTTAPDPFTARFGSWYADFASFGKPLLITETATFAGSQAQYLQTIANDLQSFPDIKGVLYFDAPANSGMYTYPLDTDGMKTFQDLSRSSYFLPERETPKVAVTATPNSSRPGQTVRLDAAVDAPDLGGTVSYSVDGTPVANCQAVPISTSDSCRTSAIPAGNHTVTAAYSGDAEYTPSSSAPFQTVVTVPPTSRRPNPSPSAKAVAPPAPIAVSTGGPPASQPAQAPQAPNVAPMAAVPPLAPLAPAPKMKMVVPSFAPEQLSLVPAGVIASPAVKSHNPTGLYSVAAGIYHRVSEHGGWILICLGIAFGIGGYIGTTWVMDRRARAARARARAPHQPAI